MYPLRCGGRYSHPGQHNNACCCTTGTLFPGKEAPQWMAAPPYQQFCFLPKTLARGLTPDLLLCVADEKVMCQDLCCDCQHKT